MSKQNKRKSTLIISIFAVGFCVLIGGNYILKSNAAVAENKKQEEIQNQIEAEKNKPIVGAKEESVKKYGYDARKIMKKIETYDYSNDGKKMVFLTFDDGPSTTNTPAVLDTLKKHNVKGTFFTCGYTVRDDKTKALLKRTFDEGNAIANHTYSHDIHKLYPGRSLDLNAFVDDLKANEQVMKDVIGDNFSTRVIRTPGGFYSWKNMKPLREYINENNMANIDWNALNKDAEGAKKVSSQLSNIAIETSKDKDIVVLLMHDTYGKEETVKSLDEVINYFKENGYEFKILI
ncbi:MAG: polysaccharide deacetylase family protein [Terrisporobacter sp.]|uniref:polysaccharide deacetylase family protein n=1 Tax=Terrisporobacter sp. TaxID=1965305 RepID=UPI002FCB0B4D